MQRRNFMSLTTAIVFLVPQIAGAAVPIGSAISLTGEGLVRRASGTLPLSAGLPLMSGDQIETGAASFAVLELVTGTTVNLGANARFDLNDFVPDVGGTIRVTGPMVFDRPDDMAPINLVFDATFARISIHGTQFFAGSSGGFDSVFLARTSQGGSAGIDVAIDGITKTLKPGQGIDLSGPDGAPGPIVTWQTERIRDAFASAGARPPV